MISEGEIFENEHILSLIILVKARPVIGKCDLCLNSSLSIVNIFYVIRTSVIWACKIKPPSYDMSTVSNKTVILAQKMNLTNREYQ